MRGRLIASILILQALSLAEVIDRIAVTVGRQVITESDVIGELRLSAFYSQAEPQFTSQSKRKAAERLVERTLIRNEMEAGQYALPKAPEADAAVEALRKRYSTAAGFQEALAKYKITEYDVRHYLLEQVAVVLFVDARFGAPVQIAESDLRDYYLRQFLPAWENEKKGPAPSFDDVREDIAQIVRKQRADGLLDNWLKEAKDRVRIEFKEEALR